MFYPSGQLGRPYFLLLQTFQETKTQDQLTHIFLLPFEYTESNMYSVAKHMIETQPIVYKETCRHKKI